MPSKIKIGDIFGDLTIIGDTGKRAKDGSIIWKCRCSCGNEDYETVSTELRRKPPRNKTHCNNSIHFINDISGQTFGEVNVLSFSKIINKKAYFHCKCLRCGKEFEARSNDLLNLKTQTCGCGKGYSRGAMKIYNLLKDNNVIFDTEVSFQDCLTENKNPMYFDFGIYDINHKLIYLIEYDGEQHFYYSNGTKTWNTKEHYELTKKRDNIKNQWCKEHNVPLIRIPYTIIESLSFSDLQLPSSYQI